MGDREKGDISMDDLQRTINERVGYNNWLVRDYEVCGILALPPFQVETMHCDEFIGLVRAAKYTTITAVASEFPCQSVYTVKDNQYYKFNAAGSCDEVAYEEIWQDGRSL